MLGNAVFGAVAPPLIPVVEGPTVAGLAVADEILFVRETGQVLVVELQDLGDSARAQVVDDVDIGIDDAQDLRGGPVAAGPVAVVEGVGAEEGLAGEPGGRVPVRFGAVEDLVEIVASVLGDPAQPYVLPRKPDFLKMCP